MSTPARHGPWQRSTASTLLIVLAVVVGVFVALPFTAQGRNCGPSVVEAWRSTRYRAADTNPIDQSMSTTNPFDFGSTTTTTYFNAYNYRFGLITTTTTRTYTAAAPPPQPLVTRVCVQPARRRLETAGILGIAGVVLIGVFAPRTTARRA